MDNQKTQCFVCQKILIKEESELQPEVMLEICIQCKGTTAEKQKVQELLDSLADGFVCGCI